MLWKISLPNLAGKRRVPPQRVTRYKLRLPPPCSGVSARHRWMERNGTINIRRLIRFSNVSQHLPFFCFTLSRYEITSGDPRRRWSFIPSVSLYRVVIMHKLWEGAWEGGGGKLNIASSNIHSSHGRIIRYYLDDITSESASLATCFLYERQFRANRRQFARQACLIFVLVTR